MNNARATNKRAGLLVAVALVLGVLLTHMQPAMAQVAGLVVVEDKVYTVDETEVRVVSSFAITNTTVDRRDGDTVYYSFFEDFMVAVPIGATGLRLTSDGAEITTRFVPMSSEEDPDFQFVVATLPTRLRSGETRELSLEYGLPQGGLRGDNLFVSNPAFHGFPMWSNSDPGTGSIELRVPANTQVTAFGEDLVQRSTGGGINIWEPRVFEDGQSWYTYVTVQNPEARDDTRLSVAGQDIVLQSWPGDTEWTEFARDTITSGLPALESVIGSPVPEQSTLEINESVDPYLYGFAGWYTLDDTAIQVGNELDDAVLLHELSHAWFNGDLFDERWIGEGLAEEFTWQAQEELGVPTERLPVRPALTDENGQPLAGWQDRQATIEDTDELQQIDLWAYNASWWVVREIVDIVGQETMQEVISAGIVDEISYADGEPEMYVTDRDWQQFLDLLAERSDDPAAADAELDRLFRELVITPSQVEQLDLRATAREDYASFILESTVDWEVPLRIREAMTEWNFESATRRMEDAREVQNRFAAVSATAQRQELELSDAAEQLYESADHDVQRALEVLDRQEAAIDRVVAVRTAAAAELSMTERWGIGKSDLGQYVTDAEEAFTEDRFDDIDTAAAQLNRELNDAAQRGRTRLILLTGLVLAAAVVMYFLIRSRRQPKMLALNAGELQTIDVRTPRPTPDRPPSGEDPSSSPLETEPASASTDTMDLVPDVGPPTAQRVAPSVPTPPPIPTDSARPAADPPDSSSS